MHPFEFLLMQLPILHQIQKIFKTFFFDFLYISTEIGKQGGIPPLIALGKFNAGVRTLILFPFLKLSCPGVLS